jgi:preprotein translocase subunit YajC
MTPTGSGSTAALVAMAAPPDGGASFWIQLVPFALILGIFYFIILLPMKRRQKKVAEFQASLKVGDNVVTTFGVYGQIAKIDDTTVQLQVADKVRIKVSRASIGGYQGQDPVVPESGNM